MRIEKETIEPSRGKDFVTFEEVWFYD
jgi:hypothetical protein